MFVLSDADLTSIIPGCGDGPAGFNADATTRGARVVSVDPIYRFGAAEIRSRVNATAETILDQVRGNHDEFVWETIRSIDELMAIRLGAMETFLGDFERGFARAARRRRRAAHAALRGRLLRLGALLALSVPLHRSFD